MADFLSELKRRVLVYDGAMGSNLQTRNLTAEDFQSKEGCNELLVLSRPDVIRDLHASFLEAGCDVIETDSFGSTSIVLAEYDLQTRTRELNLAAARLAREVADKYSTPAKPRFVAGSIGPTTKLPSLGHISYDAMAAAYREQAEALIEGGVDVLLIETCQDLLQAKIALAACQDAIRGAREGRIPSTGRNIALQVQITLEASGTMLLGSEIGAALAVLEVFQPDVIGLNCATGPVEMNDAVRFLCQNSTLPISVLPWEKMDPQMKKTFAGPAAGKGSTYAWEGNAKVGAGRMEISASTAPSNVVIQLDFMRPFEGHNVAEFTLAPQGGSTNVTWTMRGKSAFMIKLMGLFVSMDKMIGKDFEAGLANLKAAVET